MRLAHTTALCFAGLACAGVANAQDAQNFEPTSGTWNYLSVESARTAPVGAFVPSLYVNYGRNPVARRDNDGSIAEEIISHMTTVNMLAVYGITDRIDVSLDVPFSLTSGGDGLAALPQSDGFALRDIRLTPKMRVFETELLQIAVLLPISVPVGNADKLASEDAVTVHPKAVGELVFGRTRAAVNLGYKYRMQNSRVGQLEVGNEITYSAAASHDLSEGRLFALAELFGAVPAESVNDADNSRPLEGIVGARYHTSWCGVFTGGAGVGIVGDYGTPQYRAIAGFAWQCPAEPKDRDNDGLLDKDDQCPDAPEDKDDFQDADGCPDPDNDNDGVLDTQDRCPLDAEDKEGFEDEDGCPDPDNDKDGVLDAEDRCPIDAEDKDGFEDADGCPDLDNDKDGIPDLQDTCPLKPETVNGVDDEDGCPDEARVKVTATKLEILDRVYFGFNSDQIEARSFPVLDQVAGALVSHPKITKIRVEGHTDSKGSKRLNKRLSQRRADAVSAYLIKKGVATERLEAKGYGSARPLKKPGTKGAADQNRRVEFIILEGGGAAVKDTSTPR